MPWPMKKQAEPVAPIMKEVKTEFDGEEEMNLEQEEKILQARIKKLETKKAEAQSKVESPANQINKQEVIDVIEGNLSRIANLVELLRR